MADDLGWMDVGFNGTEFYETPNLDRLCRGGMKFNRAYSGGPNCAPTRACLISGMYSPRTQIWTPGGVAKGNPSFMKLKVPYNKETTTVSSFPTKTELDPSVTSIAEVLKKAGYTTGRFGKWHVGNDTQGFDVSDSNGKGGAPGQNWYGHIDVHETLTDASLAFIEKNKDKPFFLYLCHWDVHTPIQARQSVILKYREKLNSKSWSREWNPVYAAMIQAVDASVKRVHQKLVDLGLDENTLFIFSSDNGGTTIATTNKPLKGSKGALYEGGVRVPTFMSWPGRIEPGSTTDTPITSVDFMPTFAELAGAPFPDNQPVDGTSIVPLLGGKAMAERSIFWHYPLYLVADSAEAKVLPVAGTNNLYWRGVPSSMLIKGDWKLIHFFEDNSYRLHNMKEDPTESKDLSSEYPQMASKLIDELTGWQKETMAFIPTDFNPLFFGPGKAIEKK
jgi:arylsulfatase A-like enzyme